MTDPTMPANAPAGSDSSERESCDGCDKDIAAKDGTVLGANIYCEACVAKMGASYLPDDHEFLRDLLVRESATPQTDACDVARAIIAAGFTRAHHDGERVAALEKERDAAWWLLEKHPQEIIGILKAERDALADRLDVVDAARGNSEARLVYEMQRAEAAEAKLRKPTDGGTITAEDYWRERARADAAWTRGDEAESRAAALAEAMDDAANRLRMAAMATRLTTGADSTESLMDSIANRLRAALAGNGTGGDGWIACETREPPCNQEVLGWDPKAHGFACVVNSGEGVLVYGWTHWRPLPAPPSAGETTT